MLTTRRIQTIFSAKDEFTATVGKYNKSIEGMSKRTISHFKSIATATAAIAGAATVAAGTLFAIAKTTASAGDEFAKLSTRTGVSTQTLSEFSYIAKLSDFSLQDLGMGLKNLSVKMYEASIGTKSTQATFEKLGVSVFDSSGQLRESDKVLLEVMGKMKSLKSETEKTALVQELFGKSGFQLLPLLKMETSEIERLRKEAHALGITFTDAEAKQAEAFEDAWSRMKLSFTGLKNILGKELLPIFIKTFDDITAKIIEIDMQAKIKEWVNAFETLGETIKTAFNVLFFPVKGWALIGKEISKVAETVGNAWYDAKLKVQGYSTSISMIPRGGLEAISPTIGAAGEIVRGAVPDVTSQEREQQENKLQVKKEYQELAIVNDIEFQMIEQEAMGLGMEGEIEMMRSYDEEKLFISKSAYERRLEAEEEFEREYMAVGLNQAKFSLDMTSNFLTALQGIQTRKGKSLFLAMKGVAIAQASVSGYEAAVHAWKWGDAIGGIPLAVTYMAISLATTGMQIAKLRAMNIGGGGGSGGGGGMGGGGEPRTFGAGAEPKYTPATEKEAVKATQKIDVNIYNPLSQQNWAEIAENNIIPALQEASDRNIVLDVRTIEE